MHQGEELEERRSRAREMKQLGTALHDLCQPLTTLQCGLEVSQLVDTLEEYREVVKFSVSECARLMAAVRSMQQIVQAATREAVANGS